MNFYCLLLWNSTVQSGLNSYKWHIKTKQTLVSFHVSLTFSFCLSGQFLARTSSIVKQTLQVKYLATRLKGTKRCKVWTFSLIKVVQYDKISPLPYELTNYNFSWGQVKLFATKNSFFFPILCKTKIVIDKPVINQRKRCDETEVVTDVFFVLFFIIVTYIWGKLKSYGWDCRMWMHACSRL